MDVKVYIFTHDDDKNRRKKLKTNYYNVKDRDSSKARNCTIKVKVINDTRKSFKTLQTLSIDEIFEQCKISESVPISFANLEKNFKIDILGVDFNLLSQDESIRDKIDNDTKICGMSELENDCLKIYYNNNYEFSIPEQRFFIASELAYCINNLAEIALEGHIEIKTHNNKQNVDKMICEKFARDFLIPTNSLKSILEIKNIKAKKLAQLFLVPEEQMKAKLKEI